MFKENYITADIFFSVNGGWSRWHIQSKCSVSCGGGFKISNRSCNNPTPAYGGHHCLGLSTKIDFCNTKQCPGNCFYNKRTNCSCLIHYYTYVYRLKAQKTLIRYVPQSLKKLRTGKYDWYLFYPVNGGWSAWQGLSKCSVTCGTGVRTRNRYCNNPTPAYGGHHCLGLSTQSESCNTTLCPGNFVFKKSLCAFVCVIQ